eukprot:4409333-Prorocentrum_lima.AAC.1
MTSSLVGSEMCIRDRSKAWHTRLRLVQGCGLCILSGVEPSGALTIGAVSYTHLTLPTICSV